LKKKGERKTNREGVLKKGGRPFHKQETRFLLIEVESGEESESEKMTENGERGGIGRWGDTVKNSITPLKKKGVSRGEGIVGEGKLSREGAKGDMILKENRKGISPINVRTGGLYTGIKDANRETEKKEQQGIWGGGGDQTIGE